MRSELMRLLKSARSNGKTRGREVTIALGELERLWVECDGRCALTKIPFDLTPFAGKRRPFAVSLDRIDPMIGYTSGNCRLVCASVNYAMSDWGLGVLQTIAVALMEHNPGEARPGGRGFRGVVTREKQGRTIYEANISTPRGRIYLGRFNNGWEAHMAYRDAAGRLKRGESIAKRREKLHQDSQQHLEQSEKLPLSA